MSDSKIKKAQIPHAGYDYQNLYGMKILIDWYHNPSQYNWIKLECEDEKTSGIDDIKAKRENGQYEFWQIKFTVDSRQYRLDFNWLLEKKKKGTSILQKIYNAISQYKKNEIYIVRLVTNRIPSEEFFNCLIENFLDIEKISATILKKVSEQLGEKERIKQFFKKIEFIHSYTDINGLENKLCDDLVPNFTREICFERLKNEVTRWTRQRNEPNSDGKITIDNIRDILEIGETRTISQEFKISTRYCLPSLSFHKQFLEDIKSSGAWVLYGRPGVGKSTYLSYLFEELSNKNIAVVRNH